MIQELFGSGLISGERRVHPITTNGTTILQPPSYSHNHHHSSPSPSPSTATTSTTTAASLANSSTPSSSSSTAPSADHQHLRCPRCDSSNTKFCYYNNYNLTQPRHFCKTCRRYWTKGGALRNVPIGGGCRKNRISTTTGLIPSSSSSTAKLKSLAVEFGNSPSSSSPSLFGASLYDLHHESLAPSSPILWSSPQTNSHHHFLSLLRPTPNPRNPSPNPSSTTTIQPTSSKHEGNHGLANLFGTSTTATTTTHLFEPSPTTARTLDGWNSASPVNNNNNNNRQHQQAANSLGLNYPPIPIWMGDSNGNGYLVGSDEPHHNNTGYDVFNDGNNNVGSTSAGVASSSSTVAAVAGGGGGGFVGYSWNPAAFTSSTSATAATTTTSWSDLPTTANNGTAYP